MPLPVQWLGERGESLVMNAWVIGEVSEDRGPDKISNDTSTDPDH